MMWKMLSTYFPKCFAKVLREAVVQNGIGYAQVGVGEYMTEDLNGYGEARGLVHLKRLQDQNNLRREKMEEESRLV